MKRSDKVIVTRHFANQMRSKGISKVQVFEALYRPYKVTDVTRYPGQKRYCGNAVNGQPGVAVVVRPENNAYVLVTLYLDGIVTAMRADQMNDPHAISSQRLNRK